MTSWSPGYWKMSAWELAHIGDTYNPIESDDLGSRLRRAGFADVRVDTRGKRQRWRALK